MEGGGWTVARVSRLINQLINKFKNCIVICACILYGSFTPEMFHGPLDISYQDYMCFSERRKGIV